MEKKLDIAIVTFHCSFNFGSALQAYALQTAIKKYGHRIQIIDYRSRDFNSYRLMRLSRPKTIIHLLSRYSRNNKRKKSFEVFWRKYLNLTSKRYTYKDENKLNSLVNQYDCFVCGSDQIWNLDCTHGAIGPFFLDFAGNKKRVAYAPSLAHTSFQPENFNKNQIAGYLQKFDYLSIREEDTLHLFQPLVDKKIEVVLDPTLLLDAEDYRLMIEERVFDDNYIFVYLLRECPVLIKSAKKMATTTGKRIVYISEKKFKLPNSKNLFGCGPEEFLSLIKNADMILTNSFHATVFSVLFHKPFRVFATDKSASRITCLLDDLGLPNRYSKDVNSTTIEEANWIDVQARLEKMREHSWNYLKKALA
jgi:hypothetical protein